MLIKKNKRNLIFIKATILIRVKRLELLKQWKPKIHSATNFDILAIIYTNKKQFIIKIYL